MGMKAASKIEWKNKLQNILADRENSASSYKISVITAKRAVQVQGRDFNSISLEAQAV